MRATVTRQEALRLLKIEHEAVLGLAGRLTEAEMTRPDTIRHGLYFDQECSFKDLLAHLICYEAYTVAAIQEWQAGRKHWVIDAVQNPRQSRDIHYGGIAERAHLSLAEQLAEYRQVSAELEQALGAMSAAAWQAGPPYPAAQSTDLGGMIESIMVMPPRPLYRHLPVHVPTVASYIRSLRSAASVEK